MASASAQASPQEKSTEDIQSILIETIAKSIPKITSPAKRKRRDTAAEEVSPKKRVRGQRTAAGKGESVAATVPSAEKATPAKLGRPKKTQPLRHMTQTYPAGRKVKGDIFDFRAGSLQKSASKQPVSAEAQTLKLASRQKGAKPSARRVETLRSTTQAATPGEGQASAILNGHVDATDTSKRGARTRTGQGESSGKSPAISPVASGRGTSGRVANHGTKRAVGRPPKRALPQVNNDEGEDHAVSEQAAASENEPPSSQGEIQESSGLDETFHENEPPSGQGEIQESSGQDETFHERSSQTHNDEDNQPVLDLLGQEDEWKKIFEAARSVGPKKLRENRMPQLQTETIRTLLIDIKEARTLYERLSPYNKVDQDQPDGLYEQLQRSLDVIEEQIKHGDISEAAPYIKRSKIIRDIYACAIPALVFLLDSSFSFHGLHSQGLRRFEALEEIVRLQEMIVLLCMKVKNLKANPNTDNPIKKPTTSIIYPYTRGMKKIFEIELEQQKRKWKIKQNALKTAKSEEERIEQSQRQREESTSEKGHSNGRIFESIQREREILRSSRNRIGKPAVQSTQTNSHHRSNTKWTEEEEKELMTQLRIGYNRDQSAEDRYLAILNARLLQNKLPERVREQALSLKPLMLEIYGALNPPVSLKWIESIV
ncbi:hypothetical protein OEA41_002533 [Lepraria neglecta]|uniref:Uncharacterized protein n=1 Tax=Lepraria neglecta TaxID=209136 RepID=A0AAD9ZCQ2_9LECA|nr:hypothetical protein OEA41_002533 [Lepraria neglecta]